MSAHRILLGVLLVFVSVGCWSSPSATWDTLTVEQPVPSTVSTNGLVPVEERPEAAAIPPADAVGPLTPVRPVDLDRVRWHIPDPEDFRQWALQQEQSAERALKEGTTPSRDARADQAYYEALVLHLSAISRPRKLDVTLEQALHLALAHSYAIRIESYNPAVSQTEVVEAEAAFDATFYTNLTKNIQNVPTASALQGSNIDTFVLEGGLRQLLPVGMTASTSLSLERVSNNFVFQTLNPQYNSAFVVQFRQPMLRGFGLDFNRSQINIRKNDKRVSDEAFVRKVQDTLRDVENGYWRLVQARRIVAIQARLLAEFEQIYRRLEQRAKFDVIPIQINETKARLESTRANFIRACNEVRNAEDGLVALVNAPNIDLADNIELIPRDFPTVEPVVTDRLAEVQAALDCRQEIVETKIQINTARLLVGVAKNQVLPKADVVFRYTVDGLGESADDAFDQVTKNDFQEYYIGVEFELPVGNRARRAAERRARLQHAQAIASLKQVFEQVILDVNVRLREMLTQYNQIGPNLESAEAGEDQVDSIRARAETQNYIQLSNELTALQGLAANRNDLLRSLVEYNIAIIELERAKGTLLDYYNVAIPETKN